MSSNPSFVPSATKSDVAISVRDLSKCYHAYARPRDRLKQLFAGRGTQHYEEIWALRDVTFEIKRGETVGIVGRNGSGKSTLLQLICGTVAPTNGEVHVNGKIAALLELGAGFNPEFTGRENVFLNAALYGLSRRQVEERFDRIAAFADLGKFIDQPVRTYSSGMFVRLAFAVIAHVDADILVIDEALAVGDVYFVQKCMRFLRDFTTHGTLLFVSHDTNAVVGLCSDALLLEKGLLTRRGTPKEVAEVYLRTMLADSQKIPLNAEHDERTEVNNNFHTNRAEITHVELTDSAGRKILTLNGGESVVLKINARTRDVVSKPIIGFVVRDRLGQVLFGKNTFGVKEAISTVESASGAVARFEFRFPKLAAGHYSISASFATGTDRDHEQLHWIHDAAVIQIVHSDLTPGIFDVAFEEVTLRSDPSLPSR